MIRRFRISLVILIGIVVIGLAHSQDNYAQNNIVEVAEPNKADHSYPNLKGIPFDVTNSTIQDPEIVRELKKTITLLIRTHNGKIIDSNADNPYAAGFDIRITFDPDNKYATYEVAIDQILNKKLNRSQVFKMDGAPSLFCNTDECRNDYILTAIIKNNNWDLMIREFFDLVIKDKSEFDQKIIDQLSFDAKNSKTSSIPNDHVNQPSSNENSTLGIVEFISLLFGIIFIGSIIYCWVVKNKIGIYLRQSAAFFIAIAKAFFPALIIAIIGYTLLYFVLWFVETIMGGRHFPIINKYNLEKFSNNVIWVILLFSEVFLTRYFYRKKMSEKACPECKAIFSIKNEVIKRVFLDEETVERNSIFKDNINRNKTYNVRIKYYEDTVKTTCDKCEYELVYNTNTTEEDSDHLLVAITHNQK